MENSYFGMRPKKEIEVSDLENGLEIARELYHQGSFFEALDVYEQLIENYPHRSYSILAEVYDCYKNAPKKDRYNLYQGRHFDFGIKPTDKVLDIGSGHLPFPLATHLAEYAISDNSFGRAGQPFKYLEGKPVIECNVEEMPFEDKEFDFVYCSHVLEHVNNPEKACSELIRVGKRGYIETPTRGKDLWLSTTKISNHKWSVESLNNVLYFTPYTSGDIEGFGNNILLEMFCNPQSERERAFSAILYLKADLINVMFLWVNSFSCIIRH